MATLPEASVDAIVCDPPYELGFMGKGWDRTGVANDVETWRAALRVLKPGGHLLAFGGTRTYHRMACAIEDAGFEVRDQVGWLYGSGFPKSLDVSKAIDKLDAVDERLTRARRFQDWLRPLMTPQQIDDATSTHMGHHLTKHPTQPCVPTERIFAQLRPGLPPVPEWVEQLVRDRTVESETYKRREVIGMHCVTAAGQNMRHGIGGGDEPLPPGEITTAATDAARQWQGWGTALKPAWEPICMARKPLVGTVAANVLAHGTGALNIDGCRVPTAETLGRLNHTTSKFIDSANGSREAHARTINVDNSGGSRWPANVIHDGSDEVIAAFPETKSGTLAPEHGMNPSTGWSGGSHPGRIKSTFAGSEGSAARFFKECKWDESNDRPASNAASPSSSCETPTAAEPAGAPTRLGPESPPSPASTSACKSSIPSRSPAPAELWDSIDITPTTPTPCESNGSAQPATVESINSERRAAAGAGIDLGSATRFWYSPKASRYDRNDGTYDLPAVCLNMSGGRTANTSKGDGGEAREVRTRGNHHPTVKPTDLMRYLCRLVTPPGGTVLDPFMGSGSTLKAAELEGFDAIGIELDPAYIEIARRRIASDAPLFADVA
jgi:hypothetical protein